MDGQSVIVKPGAPPALQRSLRCHALVALFVAVISPGFCCLRASAADLLEVTQLFRTGKYSECVEAAGQAIAANDFSENYRLLKIRAEMELGRYEDALKTFDQALERFPPSIQLRWVGRDVCRFNGLTERAAKLEAEIGEMLKAAPWRYSDAVNQITVGRYYVSQGMDPKKVLDTVYNVIKKRQPTYAETFLAIGCVSGTSNELRVTVSCLLAESNA
jgi:tetratricopeptide (TPR) repeat protein